jgi:hypothetical protein
MLTQNQASRAPAQETSESRWVHARAGARGVRMVAAGIRIALVLAFMPGCKRSAAEQVPSTSSPIRASSASRGADSPRSHVTQRAAFVLADSEWTLEDAAMTSRFDAILTRAGAAAVTNGGFFGVDGRPEGLAVSRGKRLSGFSPEMSGGVLWIRDGVAHLTATEDYEASAPELAIQCRPRLVVASRVNIKRDDGKRARRTALCVREAGRVLEIDIAMNDEEPTLFELATELAASGCEEALNLDGGPSTGFAFRTDGGIASAPSRGPVRHAIVVRAR